MQQCGKKRKKMVKFLRRVGLGGFMKDTCENRWLYVGMEWVVILRRTCEAPEYAKPIPVDLDTARRAKLRQQGH